jgi:hypothetical protein
MKIRIVSSRDEIAQLDPEERVVHLTICPTTIVLLELIKRCPKLDAVQIAPFQFRNMSKSNRGFLEVQGVKIFEGLIQGYRTDMNEYRTIDDGLILQRAEELRVEGLDSEEIVAKVAREVEVSPGLVGFILDSRLRLTSPQRF